MSLCYDFEKWTIVTLSSITITMIVGFVSIAYGEIELDSLAPNAFHNNI